MNRHSYSLRAGFGLIGLIVMLAIMAVIAGIVGPMAYREFVAARVAETKAQLAGIQTGLEAFYRDTGRLPTEAEGLAALATNPGVGGWAGPYVNSGRQTAAAAIAGDAWNRPFVFDRNPVLDTGVGDAMIASGGPDRTVGSGTVGGTWATANPGDDLQILVAVASASRDMAANTQTLLETMGQAAQEYFRGHAAFPAAVGDLAGTWLDPGVGGSALLDGWGGSIDLQIDLSVRPPLLTVISRGPDGAIGGPDDLTLTVSSAAPGRRSTLYELGIAQALLDAAPSLVLTGVWETDRTNLGLGPVHATDGWNVPYAVRVSTRTIFSAGPDANYLTPADNLPAGTLP